MVYKISHIINGTVKKIYVFNGQKNSKEPLDKLFQRNPADPRFDGIFSPEELTDIQENSIEVRFIPENIHLDDTIEIIKKKVLLHLINDINASFDEVYFFIVQSEQFKVATIYQNLTQNEKLELTKERLVQFLLNIDEIDATDIPDKEVYTYDDLLALNLEQSIYTVCKPLGQKIVSTKDDYPYTINPFHAESYDTFLEKFADEMITTTNKNIMMDHGPFLNNTIYLCLAEDVLTFGNYYNLSLAESSTLKIYFPYLFGKEITTVDQLNDKKQELLAETRAMLTPTFEKNSENVNLFYDIYDQRKEELKFNDVGIKSLILMIQQPTEINLPLDNVFKLLHATQDIPMIKMNLSKRQENMYRFYADKIATNGKKIPYLDKGAIFKWDKVMGKKKSVAVFIEHYEEDGSKTPILCEFNNDGSILINANFNTSLSLEAINELFIKEVNPVINVVKEYLAQDGYTMNNFVDLKNASTEILNIEFVMNIHIEKDIKIKRIVGCLTSIFNVINDNLENGIRLRFKRVSNYNEMESQEALILDMSQPYLGYTDNDIIQFLQTNFQLSQQAAVAKYAEVKSAQATMESGNKKLKKRNNPGFLTEIVKQKYKNIVMIKVTGINHIDYLNTLRIYLDTLIRITQKESSTQVSKSLIKSICSGKKMAEEKNVDEIIAQIEQPNAENIQMTIVAEELVFNKAEETEFETFGEAEDMDEAEFLARYGYQEEEEEESETGGAGKGKGEAASEEQDEATSEESSDEENEILETDITGQKLANPSPFEKRMRKYDKNLFKTKTGNDNFSSYATDCQINRRRQPVILTDEEKAKIDRDHPGSYEKAIKYGTDASKQFWYICPRYWDLKKNVSLTEDEVDKSLVIPKKPDGNKVPPGKQIFEFNDYGTEHIKDNKYVTHFPGFLKAPNEERGACLPCCFKKWDGLQAGLRAKCTNDATIVVPPGRKKKKEEIDEYILAPDKFPITQENRFGYLPIAVQKFLHTDNKKCQVSDMDIKLKDDHECLLRHSVEINQNQSFVACIADIWFESYKKIHKEKGKPTIKRMKEIFVETLTIDNFVTLQNGNLIKLFYKNNRQAEPAEEPAEEEAAAEPAEPAEAEAAAEPAAAEAAAEAASDMAKYAEVFSSTNSKLYEVADKANPVQMSALIKVARAYANFIAYLKDDTVEIDYEYLWDLICKPNPKLFPKGINMVIIELTRRDVSESVELICPSNHYATAFFDTKRETILILKVDNFYEPIYAYKTNADEITIRRTFSYMDNSLMTNIKYVLTLVKESFKNKCTPLASMPNVYKFGKNIPVEKLINSLQVLNYTIENQVMNYDSKIIGVIAINNADNTKGFIPCNPTAPLLTAPFVFMEDTYTDTYQDTKDFLEKVYTRSKKQIPCKPYMKIIDDGLIIGILTITNQFVLISEPIQDTFGTDLKIMKNANYNEADKSLGTAGSNDIERINYIKKIQLETKFYNVFRTTARYLLGQYENNDIRREIEEKSKSSQLYLKKLRSIETLLRDLMQSSIQIHKYEESELLQLDNITSCYNNCDDKPYCRRNEETGDCALLIPETNLINQKPNDTFYYGKLADEIIRYSRIKSFIFNPKSVLSFSQLKYNLRENEIILSQSLLTQDYFENNIPAKVNPYIEYNSYDTTQPIVAQKYSNSYNFEKTAEVDETDQTCKVKRKEYIASKHWQAAFPLNSKEDVYLSTPTTCSFNAISVIIKNNERSDITINQLKEVLLDEYLKIYDNYGNQILKIFRAQGKKLLAGQIKEKKITLSDMIISEDYYATVLDIWLLAIHYNIPLVFLSDTSLMENNGKFMVANAVGANAVGANASSNQDYYFLKVSATLPQIAPIYTLIISEDSNKIAVDKIRDESMKSDLRRAVAGNTLIPFIKKFSLTEANTRKKIIKGAPAIEKEPEPAIEEEEPEPAAPEPAAPEPAAPEPAAPEPEPAIAALEPAIAAPEPAAPEPVPSPAAPVKKKKGMIKIKERRI